MSLLLDQSTPDQHVRFAVWSLTETEAELETLTGLQAPTRLKTPSRRLEYLAVRALAVAFGLDPAAIGYKSTGQPYLSGDHRTISITHTKGYAALLLSDHPLVGIDMEARSDRALRIRHKFMHPEEETLMQAAGMDEVTGLLLHWCVKEAVFKAISEEGVDFKSDIRVDIGSNKATFVPTGKRFTLETWPAPAYVLVVCY